MSEQGFDRTMDRPRGYNELLAQLLRRVERVLARAILAVNRELVAAKTFRSGPDSPRGHRRSIFSTMRE